MNKARYHVLRLIYTGFDQETIKNLVRAVEKLQFDCFASRTANLSSSRSLSRARFSRIRSTAVLAAIFCLALPLERRANNCHRSVAVFLGRAHIAKRQVRAVAVSMLT